MAVDRYRVLRNVAVSYRDDVRDFLLFFCAVLFTGVWWGTDHHKASWLPMFVVLIVVSVLTAWFAFRSYRYTASRLIRRKDQRAGPRPTASSEGHHKRVT